MSLNNPQLRAVCGEHDLAWGQETERASRLSLGLLHTLAPHGMFTHNCYRALFLKHAHVLQPILK